MQHRLAPGLVPLGLGLFLALSSLQSGAQRPPPFDRSQVEAEVMQLLDRWMEAFNRLDLKSWERTFHFPHYRLAGGQMEVLDGPGQQDHEELKSYFEAMGWHHSLWNRRRIVHISEAKVHVDAKFTRYRSDGSVIASHESLYMDGVFGGQGWKGNQNCRLSWLELAGVGWSGVGAVTILVTKRRFWAFR